MSASVLVERTVPDDIAEPSPSPPSASAPKPPRAARGGFLVAAVAAIPLVFLPSGSLGGETVFLVPKLAGRVVGFENLCRHIPISIDYDDNRFFTPDHEHFICQTHGALYEPLTGKCVRGPCEGNSLYPLDIVVQKGVIWLRSTERQARDPAR